MTRHRRAATRPGPLLVLCALVLSALPHTGAAAQQAAPSAVVQDVAASAAAPSAATRQNAGEIAPPGVPPAAESMLADTARPKRWDVSVDLSAAGASGNEKYLLLTSGFSIKHTQTTKYALQLDGLTRYGTNGGQTIARLYRGSVHYDITPEATWSPFLFATAERDLFRKLELRAQGGAGAKYTFSSTPDGKLSISLALLYDHEDLSAPSPTQNAARFSWRFKGDHKLGGGVKLENTSFYQPIWNDGGDYLLSSITTLASQITHHVALTVSYDFERNSTPPEGVLPDDQLMNVGLKLTF